MINSRKLMLTLAVIAVFFVVTPKSASADIQQLDASVMDTDSFPGQQLNAKLVESGALVKSVGLSGTVTKVSVYLSPGPGITNIRLDLYDTSCSTGGHKLLAQVYTNETTFTEGVKQLYTFDLNYTFTPDICYSMNFVGQVNFDSGVVYAWGSPDPEAWEHGLSRGGMDEAKDMYFILQGSIKVLRTPVIIVPGIMGSWWKRALPDLSAAELVLDPLQHTYDSLVNTFDNNGYTIGEDLFPFPYDWRLDNRITAVKLKDKIAEAKAACQCNKVHVIAHSMGGLVARYYIESDLYQNDIDQLFLIGTPNNGSPKAYLAWEAGELTPGFFDNGDVKVEFLMYILARMEGFSNRFDYIRNKPLLSIQQLLSTASYLKDPDTNTYFNYPDGYPENPFLDSKTGLNSPAMIQKLSNVSLTNIIGSRINDSTINEIKIVNDTSRLPLWEHGYPEGYDNLFGDHGLVMGKGDGTVPVNSARINRSGITEIILDAEHSELVGRAAPLIFKDVVGREAKDPELDLFIHNLMTIAVFSPLDFQVIDPQGRRIGKDFVNNQDVNEIPLAYYTGFESEHMEFLTIPNPVDGEYQIVTKGTGEGEYKLAVNYISEGTASETEFVGYIENQKEINFTFNFVELKPEETIIVPEDKIAPLTEIHADGLKGNNDWFMGDIEISFSAQDNDGGVGVLKTEYSLNNGEWITYDSPIILGAEGLYDIRYRSKDLVNNMELEKVYNVKLDKTPPEAKMYFDPFLKEFKVEGIDSLSVVTVTKENSDYILIDESGHKLRLNFFISQLPWESLGNYNLTLKNLQYDDSSDIPKQVDFRYMVNSDHSLFTQSIKGNSMDIYGSYDPIQDKTIMADMVTVQSFTFLGLKLIQLLTNGGILFYTL